MAGAAFAGGAYVSLQLQGAQQMGSELDNINSDMRQFQKIARDAMNAFDIDVSVDQFGNFVVAGEDAAEVVQLIEEKLKSLQGVQRTTTASIKDETMARKMAQQGAEQLAATEERLANHAKRDAEIKKRAAEKEKKAKEAAAAAQKKKEKDEKAYLARLKAESKWQEALWKKEERAKKEEQRLAKQTAKVVARAEEEKRKKAEQRIKRVRKLLEGLAKSSRQMVKLQGFAVGLRTIGTIGNALKSVVQYVADTAARFDQVGKAASRAGTSVEFMSTLTYAAEQSGASVEQLQSGLKAMQRNIGLASMGTGEAVKALDALGVSAESLQAMTPEEQMTLLTDKLAGIEDGSQRAAIATRIFGEGGQELANMMANGAGGLSQYREEMDALGLTMSQEQTDNAAKFNDSLNIMSKTMDMLKSQLVDALAPALEELATFFNAFIQTVMEFDQENQSATDNLSILDAALQGIKATMYLLVAAYYTAISGWYAFEAAFRAVQWVYMQGIATMIDQTKGLIKIINKGLEAMGFGGIDTGFLDILQEDAQRWADDMALLTDRAATRAAENAEKAGTFAAAAWAEASGDGETEIQRKVEDKQDNIKEVMKKSKQDVPKVELKLDDDSKEAFKGLADFSSSTTYGVEGLKKAQQNSDEKQIALLKKIAKNTEDSTGLVGV